jgi:hypothetical protein
MRHGINHFYELVAVDPLSWHASIWLSAAKTVLTTTPFIGLDVCQEGLFTSSSSNPKDLSLLEFTIDLFA